MRRKSKVGGGEDEAVREEAEERKK